MVTVMSGITATTTWWVIASVSEETCTFHLMNWAALKWSTWYSGFQAQGFQVRDTADVTMVAS